MIARQLRSDFAIFLHSPSGGGAQRRTITLANAFAARGYEVDLVMVSAEGPLEREIAPRVRVVELTGWRDGHPLSRLPRRLQLVLAVPLLARWLRKDPVTVFLSAASHVHLPALLARRLAKSRVPIVLRVSNHLTRSHDSAPQRQPGLKAWLSRRLFADAAAAVAVSEGVARDLARATGFPPERILTVLNPIDAAALERRSHETVAHPWFAAGQPPVLLGVGRLVKQKDFATLLRAFAKLRARRPARLVVLGRNDNERRLRDLLALADSLGIGNDVDFAGYVDNPAPYFRQAALLALSSRWEGLPGVLIEAMACGCPVLSTDCPSGPAEILEGGRYGRLVPVADADALADAMAVTLDAPLPRELLQARAAEFGVDRAVDRYLECLSSLRACAATRPVSGEAAAAADVQATPALR